MTDGGPDGAPNYFIEKIEVLTPRGFVPILHGAAGKEFAASVGPFRATRCDVAKDEAGAWKVVLSGGNEFCDVSEEITLPPNNAFLSRKQTYRFLKDCRGAIFPGFTLPLSDTLRYTYCLRAHERPLSGLKPMRSPVDWALPFPFHVWHDQKEDYVALYGLDKSVSPGTLEFIPNGDTGGGAVNVYVPEVCPVEGEFTLPTSPAEMDFAKGDEVTLKEVIAARVMGKNVVPLLEAERMAFSLTAPRIPEIEKLTDVTSGIIDFYLNCELWDPNALGKGRGWFRNMWVRTQTGPARKEGEMSGYFDLGWGEGIAVEIWAGVLSNWKRTNDTRLLPYVDEMTRNMPLFERGGGKDNGFFDRSNGKKYGDFLMDVVPGERIWTHALGHTGSQLIQLYENSEGYPNTATREQWRDGALSIGRFFSSQQQKNGDLPDIFDENNHEANVKSHRITARAVVCGLWARLSEIYQDGDWLERSARLANAIKPEVERYEYYNQMLDGIVSPKAEYRDGEAAYYVLEGLVPLYGKTRDESLLTMCRAAAAEAFAWTYFYDLPMANEGIARGGQCCRMNDLPLLYPIGSAKSVEPLLSLYRATGDVFYEQMAGEAVSFISCWQLEAPGKPFHGGMIHALGQFSGKHWGPALTGQIDTGMATGNSLAAMEIWIEHLKKKS